METRDPPALVDIWKRLRNKRNVIAFIDSKSLTDFELILSWFDSITKAKLSYQDIIVKNGKFLCIRSMTDNMPEVDPITQQNYDVVAITATDLEEIRNKANE